MSDQWLPWYIGDHKRDTAHLSPLQDGAYRRLIDHYYVNGPLADDDQQLATITGLSAWQWHSNKLTIMKFFSDSPRTDKISNKSLAVMNLANATANARPLWFHRRIEKELVKRETINNQRRISGQLGGIRKTQRLRVFTNEVKSFSTDQTKQMPWQMDTQPQPHKDKKGVGEEDREVVSEQGNGAAPITASSYLVENMLAKIKG
jgi:uncharacterized protein YdaU (DUF1376 family)